MNFSHPSKINRGVTAASINEEPQKPRTLYLFYEHLLAAKWKTRDSDYISYVVNVLLAFCTIILYILSTKRSNIFQSDWWVVCIYLLSLRGFACSETEQMVFRRSVTDYHSDECYLWSTHLLCAPFSSHHTEFDFCKRVTPTKPTQNLHLVFVLLPGFIYYKTRFRVWLCV